MSRRESTKRLLEPIYSLKSVVMSSPTRQLFLEVLASPQCAIIHNLDIITLLEDLLCGWLIT
jgi:hypothetical protein